MHRQIRFPISMEPQLLGLVRDRGNDESYSADLKQRERAPWELARLRPAHSCVRKEQASSAGMRCLNSFPTWPRRRGYRSTVHELNGAQRYRERMKRSCARPGCSSPATATFEYNYGDQMVLLDVLADEAHPANYDVCRRHADSMTVPNGWTLVDRRRGPASLAGHLTAP